MAVQRVSVITGDEVQEIHNKLENYKTDFKPQIRMAKSELIKEWNAIEVMIGDYKAKLHHMMRDPSLNNVDSWKSANLLKSEILNSYVFIHTTLGAKH